MPVYIFVNTVRGFCTTKSNVLLAKLFDVGVRFVPVSSFKVTAVVLTLTNVPSLAPLKFSVLSANSKFPPLATVVLNESSLFDTVASEHTIGLGTKIFLTAPLATGFVLISVPFTYLTTAEPSGATKVLLVALGISSDVTVVPTVLFTLNSTSANSKLA